MNEAPGGRRRVFLTGGTGFVGGHVARRLAQRGHTVRALVRDAGSAAVLRELGFELVEGSLPDDLPDGALDGCEAVVHLVGIIRERPPQTTFERIHIQGTRRMVEGSMKSGVGKFVHMSALGADPEGTTYERTKYEAEELVRRSELPHVTFRPSVIVGEGGEFTGLLLRIVRYAPVIPVIGDGAYRLQPLDVKDVAEAFVQAAEREDLTDESFDLGGPHKLTYNRVLEIVCEELGLKRRTVSVPLSLVRPLVDLASSWRLPTPITSEELTMLLSENVIPGEGTRWREAFHIEPTPLRNVIRRLTEDDGGGA
ncbi:MAG: NAD(P)H-binding protein [Gemmatimonadetes bacterium]|uniref:NAD(P)H-binding protein n=1 Tax=Candidatus Kutchimonas denitrificans TaxID=3056748 RepID=A0AAE5CB63_9BACT|nr:NAD(P)H-binding protein [Gemmatimonadota bacterium]NIR75392.1 NAD(P)H-binding protein [Candidatus Kutchimonas denitrificans]NIS01706.1 NAD(P)H-binding protein [Gemmatimonadota bacterium]NIT67488.1 NAD(P)H-binding protein [Gemmatimonadota bacterium]NIU53351.1 NAD(P)H-binding protein [Gemmatimonadota bacterium]